MKNKTPVMNHGRFH